MQIQAARLVAEKKLEPELIFYADKKLRLPNLPAPVQAKLRKIKHDIKQEDGTTAKETWDTMPASHRLQLVGPRYDRLVPAAEQIVKKYGEIKRNDVHFDGSAIRVGRSHLEITTLVAKLRSLGQLDAFLAAVQKAAAKTTAKTAKKKTG